VILVALLISFGLRVFVVESFWIPSPSMEPTLHGCHGCNNDRVLVDKVSYRLHPIRRGDVIVFDRPREVVDPDSHVIKRVIGIPGDIVSGHDGKVWIGNRPLTEPYLNRACGPLPPFRATTVPPGKVFVLGDNRCDSFDSRLFGSIATSTVIGRAFLIIWPVSHRHWL
jgi:signal peptidase I